MSDTGSNDHLLLIILYRLKKKAEKQKVKVQKKKYVPSADDNKDEDVKDEDDKDEDDENFDMTVTSVIIFFGLVCTFLILLYFFYDYLGKFLL